MKIKYFHLLSIMIILLISCKEPNNSNINLQTINFTSINYGNLHNQILRLYPDSIQHTTSNCIPFILNGKYTIDKNKLLNKIDLCRGLFLASNYSNTECDTIINFAKNLYTNQNYFTEINSIEYLKPIDSVLYNMFLSFQNNLNTFERNFISDIFTLYFQNNASEISSKINNLSDSVLESNLNVKLFKQVYDSSNVYWNNHYCHVDTSLYNITNIKINNKKKIKNPSIQGFREIYLGVMDALGAANGAAAALSNPYTAAFAGVIGIAAGQAASGLASTFFCNPNGPVDCVPYYCPCCGVRIR